VFCSFSRFHEIIVIALGATQKVHWNDIFKGHSRHDTSVASQRYFEEQVRANP
jgi:hypothetical protein